MSNTTELQALLQDARDILATRTTSTMDDAVAVVGHGELSSSFARMFLDDVDDGPLYVRSDVLSDGRAATDEAAVTQALASFHDLAPMNRAQRRLAAKRR